jgi:hypothetical protein
MTTLLYLSEHPSGEFDGVARVVTALLDDHMVRSRLGDVVRGADSLRLAIRALVSNDLSGIVLHRELESAPEWNLPESELNPESVYVISVPALHIDPWVRIIAWGVCFGFREQDAVGDWSVKCTRLVRKVLAPLGCESTIGMYVDAHRSAMSIALVEYSGALDLLYQHRASVPCISGASPYWLACVLQVGWEHNALGPATTNLFPPHQD